MNEHTDYSEILNVAVAHGYASVLAAIYDTHDLRKERDEAVAKLADHESMYGPAGDALRQRVTKLEAALGLARETIRVWHGEIAWPLYQHSPEMKQINAALAHPAPDAQP